MPLYSWAARRNPTVGQAVRVLAERAWALEAVDGAPGAHRRARLTVPARAYFSPE